ncbi:hypothetical protein BaRGS_00034159 [Batillaria attramentaria]|uniref:Uncharacterized protein n=1 Tax=Batillaria attramentaria TaxID=370345 RepID=A0ABD0JI16_9CAEN
MWAILSGSRSICSLLHDSNIHFHPTNTNTRLHFTKCCLFSLVEIRTQSDAIFLRLSMIYGFRDGLAFSQHKNPPNQDLSWNERERVKASGFCCLWLQKPDEST